MTVRDDLLAAPLDRLVAEAAAVRDAQFGTRVTFSPKVFVPLTMLCRDRCGYCTFAKAPARVTAPYLTPDEVLAIARRGADLGCREALFTLGEAPEARYPVGRRVARGARVRLDRRLPRRRRAVGARRDRPAPPRQRGCAGAARARAAARGQPVAGDDDRDARGAARRARRPAPRRARQDARAPARHARRGRTRGDPVHHRHPRGNRRDTRGTPRRAGGDRRRASSPRPRAGSDRAELPAQARHRDAPGRTVPARGAAVVDRGRARSCSPPTCTCRRRPTSATTWLRCSRRASTTGAASRRSRSTT